MLYRIQVDTERDLFMTGEQAKEYGIIDEVVVKKKDEEVLRNRPG